MKKPLILVCNSYIDPVWLWEWWKVTKHFKVTVPSLNAEAETEIKWKAIKTFIVEKGARKFRETDLLERDW